MKSFIILLAMLVVLTVPLTARAKETRVTISVDGLSCPFCAYGLEKKLKKVEGVEDLTIDIESGQVNMTFKDRGDYDEGVLRKAVRDSGFTPRKIVVEEQGE